MMKKILYVATVVKTHINSFHLPYLKMLQEMGYETAVAAKNDFQNPDDCNIPYCNHYYNIPFERFPFHWKNIRAYYQLKKVIDTGDYEIIHCHTPVGSVLTRLAARNARKKGTKVYYTAHGFHFFRGGSLLNWMIYYPVEYFCARMTDTLITINQIDYELAQKKLHADRVENIPGIGVELKKYTDCSIDIAEKRKELGIPTVAFVLLSVGEITKRKNHQVIIRALSKLKNPNCHYLIAGSGLRKDALVALVKRLGLEAQVHFLGFRKDIPELCNIADVFCFPSRIEGLGLAAIEAMACGLPILTSNVHGINDYSEDGITGYKCAPNDVAGFATAIQKLYENPKLRKKMGLHNKNKVQKYDLSKSIAKMKEIYGFTDLTVAAKL